MVVVDRVKASRRLQTNPELMLRHAHATPDSRPPIHNPARVRAFRSTAAVPVSPDFGQKIFKRQMFFFSHQDINSALDRI
jgi:hypothetical protein